MDKKPGAESDSAHFFDYIIVGGGTAGCVLANRLSANAKTRVLLLEAGSDVPPGQEPPGILDMYPSSYDDPNYRWPAISGHALREDDSPEIKLIQARVIGGGSTVMGMMALRGLPGDYDRWASQGAPGWAWGDVLPYFRKAEHDLDFSGPLHGDSGFTKIRRSPPSCWSPFSIAGKAYAQRKAIPFISDVNGQAIDGFGPIPKFMSSRRMSASICYLTSAVRARRNLSVVGQARVDDLIFDGRRVVGVTAETKTGWQTFQAGRVILSAGALLTPEILLRNGIGPAAMLSEAGVTPRADLRGVGCNLQNHAMVQFVALARDRRPVAFDERDVPHGMFRFSTAGEAQNTGSLCLLTGIRSGKHAMARQMVNFGLMLTQPESRGRVWLSPAERPVRRVAYNLLGAVSDRTRLEAGCAMALDYLTSPEMTQLIRQPRVVTKWNRVARLVRPKNINATMVDLAGQASRLVPALGDRFLDLVGTKARADNISKLVDGGISPAGHQSGTCRIGPVDDSGVVDPAGRVHGFENLYVVDASIIPIVPRANTNLTVLMLAEKIADMLLEKPHA